MLAIPRSFCIARSYILLGAYITCDTLLTSGSIQRFVSWLCRGLRGDDSRRQDLLALYRSVLRPFHVVPTSIVNGINSSASDLNSF